MAGDDLVETGEEGGDCRKMEYKKIWIMNWQNFRVPKNKVSDFVNKKVYTVARFWIKDLLWKDKKMSEKKNVVIFMEWFLNFGWNLRRWEKSNMHLAWQGNLNYLGFSEGVG